MTDGPARRDPADAAAAAERLMALHRLQQQADTRSAMRGRGASRAVAIVVAAIAGAGCGALMGAARGHALAAGSALGLVGALLAFIGTRPR